MKTSEVLKVVNHRPWPLPREPWIMVQVWHDLLFAHWPIPPAVMRPYVPPELPLDTFAGLCWIGVVPFHMSNVRPRWVPPLPGLSRFIELNVRTYVTRDNKPGVYFFSLDASNFAAVWAARAFYHLPYFSAAMRAQIDGHEVTYTSRRLSGEAELRVRYRPVGPVQLQQSGTLDHWLTERYCLYTVHKNRVYRCEIHHAPWPIQPAEAEFRVNTMTNAAGILLPETSPLLHFSREQEVLIWPLHRLP